MNIKQVPCLAILIRSAAGNEGRIVEVKRFLGSNPIYRGEHWATGEGPCWEIEFAGEASAPAIYRHLDDSISPAGAERTGAVPDAWLRPISGVPVTDEVTDEVTA